MFRRYEVRIVTLELKVADLEQFETKYAPIVDALQSAALMATALAAKLDQARRGTLSRVQIAVAIAALFVPSALTAALTLLIVRR